MRLSWLSASRFQRESIFGRMLWAEAISLTVRSPRRVSNTIFAFSSGVYAFLFIKLAPFARFFNLPELMNLFKEVADIKTADQLNLPVPKVEYRVFEVKPTETQKEMMAALSERASRIHAGAVSSSEDNMLLIVRCHAQKCISPAGGHY